MRRTPGVTAAAVITLGLGIGANAAIYSFIEAVMLRTLPVHSPDGLVFIASRDDSDQSQEWSLISNPPWLERVRRETVFAGVAAYNIRNFKVASDSGVEQVVGQYASGNYHAVIGVPMALGRGFSSEDDRAPGSSPIAVISHSYWARRYGLNPDALGARISVGGHPVTIVGVTARGFEGVQPGRPIEITIPLSIRVQNDPDFLTSLDSWTVMPLVARLNPGVTAASAEPFVQRAYREHMQTPGIGFGRNRQAFLMPAARGADRLRREYELPLQVLMTMVAVVLLVACVNVANLFLLRGAARTQEVAVRLAIGAGRARLIRQFFTEGAMLAGAGAAVGFLVAGWGTRFISALFRQSQNPIVIDAQPDASVMAFTLVLAIGTSLLFSLLPALRSTRIPLVHCLRPGVAGTAFPAWSGGRLLVSAQIALCLVLAFGAGLLGRTLQNLQRVEARFDTHDVLAFAIDATDTAFPLDRLAAVCTDTLAGLRRPHVIAGSCSTMSPLDTAFEIRDLGMPAPPPGRNAGDVFANAVTPEYFRTFGVELRRGRLFTPGDTAAAARVALISESVARHFFGDQDPLGRQIAFGSRPDPAAAVTVVGVVSDVRQTLREGLTRMVYQPLDQMPEPPEYLVAAVRTTDPVPVAAVVRDVVRGLSGEVAVSWVRTMREQVQAALVTERLLAVLSMAFAALALLLACVGLYGVMANGVARRTREIGIRMALGADRAAVLRAIARETAIVVVPGIMLGILASSYLSGAVEVFLFDVTARDPLTLGLATGIRVVTCAVAAYLPARRATRIEPAVALRVE
jgi:predicted permease